MSKKLVVVESPAKAKTIKKFLGSNYKIEASMGHLRDLPKSQLGVDLENDFEPKYITIRGKGDLLSKLKKEAKKADTVYLATDPDREGEAIAWHLYNSLNIDQTKVHRITFNEITKQAVKNSIKQAREIDMDLVDSQQARRILDRIVGYKISPLLWKKVKKGLSGGRVQSVALRLICDREKQINDFIPEEYWTIAAELKGEDRVVFVADYYGIKGKKDKLVNQKQTDQVMANLKKGKFQVQEVKTTTSKSNSALPFTTSTLQQVASSKLNFTTAKTMKIAQQLYEGIDIKGKGLVGLITYLRTDSTRISEEANHSVLEFIEANYGKEYVGKESTKPQKAAKAKTQDAHEAIRPTYCEIEPIAIKESLSRDQYRLYQLIWSRFIASRMAAAEYDNQKIKILNGEYEFRTNIRVLQFQGFLKVYTPSEDETSEKKQLNITTDTKLTEKAIVPQQHFTQPPARYTEASLVKNLEENGVGRPSTYAPTISTILARGYVGKEDKKLFPTELGEVVNNILIGYFSEIVNVEFTASMEKELDLVEDGAMVWKDVIREFFPNFKKLVEKAEEEVSKVEIKDEETDIVCDKCGRNMVIKLGKYGKFLACPGFPECRNTKPLLEKIEGVACPKCGGQIVIRKTKKGRRYYGCENNPDCDFMNWNRPSSVACQRCGGVTVEKGKKLMCINENCKNIQEKPTESKG